MLGKFEEQKVWLEYSEWENGLNDTGEGRGSQAIAESLYFILTAVKGQCRVSAGQRHDLLDYFE